MTPQEYIENAIRTGGYQSKFFGELVPLRRYKGILKQFDEAAEAVDIAKKSLFYGKPNGYAWMQHNPDPSLENLKDQFLIDMLHAILGVASEAGELMQCLDKPTFDRVNVKEELGDILWYIAIACKSLNCTFEELMEGNIAKLKKRFPEKFNEYNALNRDLDGEREVLEQHHG